MKRSEVAILGLGVGVFALLAMSGSSSAAEPEPQVPQPEPAKPPRPKTEAPPPEDPLPEFPLTQQNIVDAIIEFAEDGKTLKVNSMLAKSVAPGSPPALRAYFAATLKAVPEQLKDDVAFVRDFARSEEELQNRIAAEQKRNDVIFRVVESTVTTVVTKVNAAAGAVVAAAAALLEAGRSIVQYAIGPLPRREAKDQLYPFFEGPVLRRGVSFQPDLPYITRGERELSDKVRLRWVAESQEDSWFLALPTLPERTTLRFAPRWNDFTDAVKQLKANGIVLE